MKKSSRASAPVAALLILAVVLSVGPGFYAGAYVAQQAPNVTVTTTVYTTTTSWTTSTIWSTLTETVPGILTTVEYTTSTGTVTVTSTSSSTTATTTTRTGTVVTITSVTGTAGSVTVKGYLKDAKGNGLSGLLVRITVDGGYGGRATTTSGGSFSYTGSGPTLKGTHVVTVWFDGTTQYAASSASKTYSF